MSSSYQSVRKNAPTSLKCVFCEAVRHFDLTCSLLLNDRILRMTWYRSNKYGRLVSMPLVVG